MEGDQKEASSSLFEGLPDYFRNNLVQYIGGAVIGGTAGDILQDVFSGLVVETILSVFSFLGLSHLVYNREQSQCVAIVGEEGGGNCPTIGATSEAELAGAVIAMLLILYVLWQIVRPRVYSIQSTQKQQLLFNSGVVAVSIGVVVGQFYGLLVAVAASLVAGLMVIQLDRPGDSIF